MHRISYASNGFRDRDIEAALDSIAEAGFQFTELLGQAPHLPTPLTGRPLVHFRNRLESRGLQISSIHAPLGSHVLGAPDEVWRTQNVELFASYVRFAGAVGADDIIIHPVPNPRYVDDADNPAKPGKIEAAVYRSLDELVPVAAECGVRLLLENLPYKVNYPFRSLAALRPLVDGYPAAQVGLVIDTGHAWIIGNDPATEIQTAGSRLWGTHLQDVDYDDPEDSHWVPGHGGLDWTSIRQALAEVDYGGAWTLEVNHGRHGESPEAFAVASFDIVRSWDIGAIQRPDAG